MCEANCDDFDHCNITGHGTLGTLASLEKTVKHVLILHQQYIVRGVEIYRTAKIRLKGASVMF